MKKFILCTLTVSLFALLASHVQAATFNRNLSYGLQSDSDVQQLQEFLKNQNLYSGPITGNFFALTQRAVISFQQREGINPAAGYFGAITRSKVNSIVDQNNPVPQSTQGSFSLQSAQTPTSISIGKINNNSSDLQAQINALMEQVRLLQNKLQTQPLNSPPQTPASSPLPTPNQTNSNTPNNLIIQSGQSTNISVQSSQPTQSDSSQIQPANPTNNASTSSSTSVFGQVVPGSIIIAP